MAEDVNALFASTLERARNVRKGVDQAVVEIPFWLYPEKPKWVSGIRSRTTVGDILMSLVRSDSNKMFEESDVRDKRLVLVEQWRGVERPLAHSANILKIWTAWGEEKSQVRFVVKKISSSSTSKSTKKFENSASASASASAAKNVEQEPSTFVSDPRRKTRRRRNSVSSVGSFGDELHPRRLAKMTERRNVDSSQPLPPPSSSQRVDVFDEHIEEMMKIIVAQGRRICEELKRVQQVRAHSKSR